MSSSGSEGEHHHSIERLGEKRSFNDSCDNGRGDYPPAKKSNVNTGRKCICNGCFVCVCVCVHLIFIRYSIYSDVLTDNDEETFLKFLLPNFVSGMIIGSAGSKVSKMMEDTNTVIKFSPGRELYPGTTDRVCIIIGAIPDICAAVRRIHDTMSQSTHLRAEEIQDLKKHFKMVISNIASGMVIGKSGLTVKSIQSDCGVKIQISNKDENSLPERMLTISGETEAILKAVQRVLEHTIDDPDANKWKRMISYSGYSVSPGTSKSSRSSSSLTSSGHSSSINPSNISMTPQHSNIMTQPSAAAAAAMAYGHGGTGANMSDSTSAFLSLLQQQQQHQAYSAYGATAAAAAAQTSSSGNLLNQALLSYAYSQSLMSTPSYYGQINPVMVDGVNLTIPGATLSTYEVAVPEVMVSSVVGAGGKMLADLIQTTGARVQLSGKGEYIPGTYNRKLTIAGPILSVQAAHMIVMQKILKEQDAYQKQGLI